MSIKTVQKCDKCKTKRELVPSNFISSDIKRVAQLGGWRELNGKHLCPDCVRKVLD